MTLCKTRFITNSPAVVQRLHHSATMYCSHRSRFTQLTAAEPRFTNKKRQNLSDGSTLQRRHRHRHRYVSSRSI